MSKEKKEMKRQTQRNAQIAVTISGYALAFTTSFFIFNLVNALVQKDAKPLKDIFNSKAFYISLAMLVASCAIFSVAIYFFVKQRNEGKTTVQEYETSDAMVKSELNEETIARIVTEKLKLQQIENASIKQEVDHERLAKTSIASSDAANIPPAPPLPPQFLTKEQSFKKQSTADKQEGKSLAENTQSTELLQELKIFAGTVGLKYRKQERSLDNERRFNNLLTGELKRCGIVVDDALSKFLIARESSIARCAKLLERRKKLIKEGVEKKKDFIELNSAEYGVLEEELKNKSMLRDLLVNVLLQSKNKEQDLEDLQDQARDLTDKVEKEARFVKKSASFAGIQKPHVRMRSSTQEASYKTILEEQDVKDEQMLSAFTNNDESLNTSMVMNESKHSSQNANSDQGNLSLAMHEHMKRRRRAIVGSSSENEDDDCDFFLDGYKYTEREVTEREAAENESRERIKCEPTKNDINKQNEINEQIRSLSSADNVSSESGLDNQNAARTREEVIGIQKLTRLRGSFVSNSSPFINMRPTSFLSEEEVRRRSELALGRRSVSIVSIISSRSHSLSQRSLQSSDDEDVVNVVENDNWDDDDDTSRTLTRKSNNVARNRLDTIIAGNSSDYGQIESGEDDVGAVDDRSSTPTPESMSNLSDDAIALQDRSSSQLTESRLRTRILSGDSGFASPSSLNREHLSPGAIFDPKEKYARSEGDSSDIHLATSSAVEMPEVTNQAKNTTLQRICENNKRSINVIPRTIGHDNDQDLCPIEKKLLKRMNPDQQFLFKEASNPFERRAIIKRNFSEEQRKGLKKEFGEELSNYMGEPQKAPKPNFKLISSWKGVSQAFSTKHTAAERN